MIKRLEMNHKGLPEFDENGTWVLFSDYHALEQKFKQVDSDAQVGAELSERLAKQISELQQKLDALSADLFEAWSFEKSKHFCYGLDITVGHGTPYAVRCAIDEYRKYVISVLTEYKSSGTCDTASNRIKGNCSFCNGYAFVQELDDNDGWEDVKCQNCDSEGNETDYFTHDTADKAG